MAAGSAKGHEEMSVGMGGRLDLCSPWACGWLLLTLLRLSTRFQEGMATCIESIKWATAALASVAMQGSILASGDAHQGARDARTRVLIGLMSVLH